MAGSIWDGNEANGFQDKKAIHCDIDLAQFVIPGLTRNPVFSWIPAFAGMTFPAVINNAVYNMRAIVRKGLELLFLLPGPMKPRLLEPFGISGGRSVGLSPVLSLYRK